MDVVWIKLTTTGDSVVAHMFGTGGIVNMVAGAGCTHIFSSVGHLAEVQESIDEIMALIGAARNGVKVGAKREV